MLHDTGGLATQEPGIHKLDNYHSDSSNTSSSSSVPPLSKVPRVTTERKTTTTTMNDHNHRRSSDHTKDLHKLNAPQLVDLVLHLESRLDKTETRLKKYVLRCKEQVESETQASEQANKFRQKMTQVILDAQKEAVKAKQDVEEYKFRFENVQKELQRSREIVQILENDKDEIERAFQRARDRAREYRERSAVQLAREQGRRVGFEQGLEQGRVAVQLTQARAAISALAAAPRSTTSSNRTAPRRRALTQGTEGATTTTPTTPTTGTTRHRRRHSHQSQSRTRTESFPSQHDRRSSLDSVQETQPDGEYSTFSHPLRRHSHPHPVDPPSQAQTDGGRSNASGPTSVHERREQDPTYQPSPAHGQPVSTSQRSQSGPVSPIPPAQQFPAGIPPDNVSEATTSPASTMTGMDILTFRETPVVSTSPNSSPESRKSRGQSNTTSASAPTSGGPGPGRVPPSTPSSGQQIPHSNPPGITIDPAPSNTMGHPMPPPPVVPQQTESHLTPTFPSSNSLHGSTSSNSVPHSNRSSLSVEIRVEPPSQASTPRESDESLSSGQDGQYLSPNSRPISLPRTQPPPPRVMQPHESPVLPVLPRIVSQPTKYGTPAVRPVDLAQYNSAGNDLAAGTGPIYEEAPTPPGFSYPAPLGAAVSGGQGVAGGKGKGRSVTVPQSPAGGGTYYTSGYVSKPDSSSATTSSQQPVVPPVAPSNVGIYQHHSHFTGNHGNGHHRNGGDEEEEEEDTSFDSATKRNTQLNSMMYSQGDW